MIHRYIVEIDDETDNGAARSEDADEIRSEITFALDSLVGGTPNVTYVDSRVTAD